MGRRREFVRLEAQSRLEPLQGGSSELVQGDELYLSSARAPGQSTDPARSHDCTWPRQAVCCANLAERQGPADTTISIRRLCQFAQRPSSPICHDRL
jgi:hypothetical protein